MSKFIDLTGRKFGRLTVLRRVLPQKGAHRRWVCLCVCGNETEVCGGNLVRGSTSSCGCLHREITSLRSATHRMSHTRAHDAWCRMRDRCNNPHNARYRDYGGRGIRVCDGWLESFENFLADMGEPPDGKTLDRKDNNGPYSPDNCRWATPLQQNRNQRRNIVVEAFGQSKVLSEWAGQATLPYDTIRARLIKGIRPERALTAPLYARFTPADYVEGAKA